MVESISVSVAGSYDSATGTYSWAGSGLLGTSTWGEEGQLQWVGDPTGTLNGNVDVNGEVVGTVTGTVEVDVLGHSSGTVTFTPKGAGVGSSYDVTDFVPGDLGVPIRIDWNGHTGYLINVLSVPEGVDPSGLFTGRATVQMAVPEPSIWALMLFGLVGLDLSAIAANGAVFC